MDTEHIYVKTAAGEEAMHQRTRVIRRNVRMVLILVDGHSTVADISFKTGNPQLTENALLELEKGGFVELRVDEDSIWAESKKVAQEIRDSAMNKALQISSSSAKSSQLENPEPEIQAFIQTPQSDLPTSSLSLTLNETDQVPDVAMPPLMLQSGVEKSKKKPSKENNKPSLSILERFKTLVAKSSKKSEDFDSIKPIRRGRQNTVGWPMIVFICSFVFSALSYLIISFFPYNTYLPEVEATFTQASGKPVKVGMISVSVYPKPGLLLGNVRIGQGKDEIRIAEIRLLPEFSTLTSAKLVFREVALNGATLSAEQIAVLPGVFATTNSPESRVGLKHIRLEKTEISFGGLGFSGMEGESNLSADGLFQSLTLRMPDRSVNIDIKSVAQRLEVILEGYAWRPLAGFPFIVDSANLKGDIQNGLFTIRGMELRIFEGLIQGVAVLQNDKKPSIAGEISFERVNVRRFGEAMGVGQQFAGEANGKIRFSMKADSWSSIFSGINAEGEFGIHRGSIRGIDLAEAVRRVSGTPVQGGVTIFEQLSGKLRLAPTGYQYSGLVLNSGLMQSTGAVGVSKDLMLNGRMDLQMRGTVNQTRLPVSISGPLKSPIVQLGRR